jgi:excisionase family DNA binding protein
MEKTTLNVQELASALGISRPKAYELVRQPGFPVIHVGTRILIPKDSLMNWLHAQTKGGPNT